MSTIRLSNGVWSLDISDQGQMVLLGNGAVTFRPVSPDPVLCEISCGAGDRILAVTSARLLRRSGRAAEFETAVDLGLPAMLRFRYAVSDPDEHGVAVQCRVSVHPERAPDTDVHLRWFWNFRLPSAATSLFAPLFDGRGLRTSRSEGGAWNYVCAGGGGAGERLALPMIDECPAGGSTHCTYFADPFFSTGIRLPLDNTPDRFECSFYAAAGADQFPERTFGVYLHQTDADGALQGFFRHMLPGSPPGPAWLHDIAMVHYDYLSEKGEGWFRDIDRLTELLDPTDRRKVVLTLHGWYDLLGRYAFDESTGRLERRWLVMPGGDRKEMTLEEMHRRIVYGKDRGFRVLLYYADGLAIDSGAPNFHEDRLFRDPEGNPRKHHWAGPDTIAQTYIMNPLHPRVQDFFRGYTRALLAEFGKEIDGLSWDETFTTRVGDLSSGTYAGYADRAFMLLCAELREMIKAVHPDLAFLASDDTGLALPQEEGGAYWRALPAQNALVFDGTYQDSQCYPSAWQYGLFPNYRNVLWSCNWRPVENFEWSVLGVRAFGAPVPISNGWGESRGVSRYTEMELKKTMDLFQFRKEHPYRVRWIECADR